MKSFLVIFAILVVGCVSGSDSKSRRIDIILQNIGVSRIEDASVSFTEGGKYSVGVLPSKSKKVGLFVSVAMSSEMRVVCEYDGLKKTYLVDIGKEAVEKLSTGHHVLFFQLNMDEDEVLFKCFDNEFPHDVLHSGKKLTGTIQAIPEL